jgi:hypothetical protein
VGTVRLTGLSQHLEHWLGRVSTPTRRESVVEALARVAEQYDDLFVQPGPVDDHPLVRWTDVPDADASMRLLLLHPHRGIALLGTELEDPS